MCVSRCIVRIVEIQNPPSVEALVDRFGRQRFSFVLDSAQSNDGLGEWSFFGADPFQIVTGDLADLRQAMQPYQIKAHPEIPFTGGAVGYLSYDYGRRLETLASLAEDDRLIPDMHFGLYDGVAALNHETGVLFLVGHDFSNTADAVIVPMDAGWNDIGSWSSLWDVGDKDENGNAVTGDVILHEATNSYIRADDKLVAAVGVDDMVIVSTKDALLVAHKERVQDAKLVANKLREDGRSEWELHREVYRPWGNYFSVEEDEKWKIKKIEVNPGASLSLQLHQKRAEHWIVVKGIAQVEINNKVFKLLENQSCFVPIKTKHRLSNPGETPLIIIEVQSGSYLGEDDIVRVDDPFGRQ